MAKTNAKAKAAKGKGLSFAAGGAIAIIGIVLLVFPKFVAGTVGIFVGAALIIAALYLIGCWSDRRGSIIATFYLVGGAVAGVLGLVCILHPAGLLNTIGWLVALCITIAGLSEVLIAVRAKKDGSGNIGAIVTSIAVAALGIVAMINPSIMLQLLGLALIFEGAVAILLGPSVGKKNKQETVEIIEIEPSEVHSERR